VSRAGPGERHAVEATDRAAEVFEGGFSAANEALDRHGGELRAPAVAAVAREAQAWLTGRVAEMAAGWALPRAACREGCAWCCLALSVSAWPLEVFAIADWLRENRGPGDLAATVTRLREAVREGHRQRAASSRPPRVPCALLEGNRCGVYPVRPASCVGWTSEDVAPCEAYARGDEAAKCRVDPTRMFTARAVPLAAAAALMRRGGPEFDQDGNGPGGYVDLAAGLLAAMDRGPGALAGWLGGEAVLEGDGDAPGGREQRR